MSENYKMVERHEKIQINEKTHVNQFNFLIVVRYKYYLKLVTVPM